MRMGMLVVAVAVITATALAPAVEQTIKGSETGWVATGLPSGCVMPANVITVAKSGGNYNKIQDAVDAATTGTTVLVFPGEYNEQVTGKAGITLMGIGGADDVIIRYDVNGGGWGKATIQFNTNGTLKLANITVQNLVDYINPGGAANTIYTTNNAILKAHNCKFISTDNDTVYAAGASSQEYVRCYFEMRNKQPDIVFLAGTGTHYFRQCYFTGDDVLWMCDTATVYFYDNVLDSSCPALIASSEPGNVILTAGTKTAHAKGTKFWEGLYVNSIGVDGNSGFTGDVVFYSGTAFEDIIKYNNTDGKLYFGYFDAGLGDYVLDTNLYRLSANTLKTDDAFDANSLKIGGTEVVSSERALSNVSIGGGLISSGTVADARLSSNVPLKNTANTFTNFQTISATATSDLLTVTGGNMSDGKSALRVSGALPNTAGGGNFMADFKATSSGADKNEYALNSELLAGGTTAVLSGAGRFVNKRAGTGTSGFGKVDTATGNLGIYGTANATTAGYNYGGVFDARGGNMNVGVEGLATDPKANAVNIGVFGNASNTAENGVQVGGLFGLNRTTPPASSAALICDNGNTGKDIFLAKANGTNVVKIAQTGAMELENNINVKGEIKQNGIAVIRLGGCRYFTLPNANKTVNGDLSSYSYGNTTDFGALVYLGSDGKAYKADASSTATLPAVAMVADEDAHGYFLLRGYIRNDDWDTMTIGKEVWASTTAGEITQIKPSGAGECVQSIGYAVGAKTIFFDPQRVIITLGGEE